MKILQFFLVLTFYELDLYAQVSKPDSIEVKVHPSYNEVNKFHKWVFGENYRKEWAAPTKLPVLRLSEIRGGLKPEELGGGMQSKSLRLIDSYGKEWVIRSVEKTPDALLPETLRKTFARDWVDDVTSAQHPFSALVVPPIANAVQVPHAVPVIGVVGADPNLGVYENPFLNMVVLLEEREPLGKSDNTVKMLSNLQKDHDNRVDGKAFLQARMLDAFIGDWDRHADQWRWYYEENGKGKLYKPVPRDRDQVFHLTEGVLPRLISRSYILPTLRNFDPDFKKFKWLVFKTNFLNPYPELQISQDDWSKQAVAFQSAVTDSVLETALRLLPKSAYDLGHDELLKKLQSRREIFPARLNEYYRFTQKIVDIKLSDKNELVQIISKPDGGLNVQVNKTDGDGSNDELMNKTYDRALTKEIRIYLGDGNDSLLLNNQTSQIKLRVIGGNESNSYNIIESRNKVCIYEKENQSSFTGETGRLKKYVNNDSLNTSFSPVNLYSIWQPLVTAGINRDDGLIFGIGFKFIKQEGFRKFPYASMHQLLVSHSFSTKAYNVRYHGEWIHALGKADFTVRAVAKAPNNTINYFGRGNETEFNKTGDYVTYYRTRFSTYLVEPAIRWRNNRGGSLSVGPSLMYYKFDPEDNKGRFISNPKQIGSYDSSSVEESKLHLGIFVDYINDTRNYIVLPQKGHYFKIRLEAYQGIGSFAESFAQLIPEFSFYKSLNKKKSIVLADRLGGSVSIGKTAFYQSAFIGGQENLLGYRQYRFAGQHCAYNNLELRIKIADIANYILPGQLGISTFWDIGRVWVEDDESHKWHNGVGAGIYFAPASLISFSFVMGYSNEGWYPYFTMGFRF
jgi:hypothetical protein